MWRCGYGRGGNKTGRRHCLETLKILHTLIRMGSAALATAVPYLAKVTRISRMEQWSTMKKIGTDEFTALLPKQTGSDLTVELIGSNLTVELVGSDLTIELVGWDFTVELIGSDLTVQLIDELIGSDLTVELIDDCWVDWFRPDCWVDWCRPVELTGSDLTVELTGADPLSWLDQTWLLSWLVQTRLLSWLVQTWLWCLMCAGTVGEPERPGPWLWALLGAAEEGQQPGVCCKFFHSSPWSHWLTHSWVRFCDWNCFPA